MKLWVQSATNWGVDPKWRDYEECLSRHLRKVARAGTEIELRGTRVFSHGVITHQYDTYLHTAQIVDGAIQAEREGYDAFVQTGTLDHGFLEIREAVHIPVTFPIETALHVATLLAPKVAFLVMNRVMLSRLNEKAKLYGFQERMTPGGWVSINEVGELQSAFKNPGPIIDLLVAEARRIGEQGANILICAGNPVTLLLVENGITDIDGVRILDSLGVQIKAAEMLVDLRGIGVDRGTKGPYSPLPKEEISSVRKLYGVE